METETTTSLEDMLDGAQPHAVTETPPQQAETTGDKASSAAPPADASQEQTRADESPTVPRKALEDERRKRQEMERRIADIERQYAPRQQAPQQQQQPQQIEMPDPWTDPHGYAQFVTQQAAVYAHRVASEQAEARMLNRELNRSEKRARKTHGDEIVDAALQAAQQAGVAQRFIAEDDAYEEIVNWYNDYQIAANPQSYREKIEAEILAKHGLTPQARAPAQSPSPKPKSSPVPRSLASTASAIPRDERGRFSGPTPLEDLLP